MLYNEEIYADVLSDVDNNTDSESDSDLDSGSDIGMRRFKNKGRPIISDSESDEESSLTYDWSKVDFEPDFHTCLERSGLQALCTQDIMSSVEMFLGDDLFNLFAAETNLYYYQQNNGNNNELTKNKAWIDTNPIYIILLLYHYILQIQVT